MNPPPVAADAHIGQVGQYTGSDNVNNPRRHTRADVGIGRYGGMR